MYANTQVKSLGGHSCNQLSLFLCVCMCISGPKIRSLSDLHAINRFTEPPMTGPFCDLLWSDPLLESVLGYKLSESDFEEVSVCSYQSIVAVLLIMVISSILSSWS